MVISNQVLPTSVSPQNIHSNHPYFLVAGKDTLDVWRTDGPANTLREHVQLSQFLTYPGYGGDAHDVYQMSPIIDVNRGIIIIAQASEPAGNRTSTLWVFSLETGEVLRKAELQGRWRPYPLLYREGRVIATLDQDPDEVPPEGRTSVVVCDAGSDMRIVGSVHLPGDLQSREAKRIITGGGVLRCVYDAPSGDIIGTSTEAYEDVLDVFRWRAGDLPASPQPDATLTLKARLNGCDRTYPSCSATLDASTFILVVSEEVAGLIADGYHRQMILYAIDWTTMSVRWTAEPMWGFIYDVWHVGSQGMVVVAGEREMGGWSQFYIAVLDPSTGERRSLEVINKTPNDNTPKFWGLSEDHENPDVVVIFANGSICIVPLADFAVNGFPRDGEDVRTERLLPELVEPDNLRVAVGHKSALLSTPDETGTSRLCYVHW